MFRWTFHVLSFLALAISTVPACAQITVTMCERFALAQAGGSAPSTMSNVTGGPFVATVTANDAQTQVSVTGAQNTSIPDLSGSTLAGTGSIGFFSPVGTVGPFPSIAWSLLDTVFTADVNGSFSLSGTLNGDSIIDPFALLRDKTTNTTLLTQDANAGNTFSLSGPLVMGHSYELVLDAASQFDRKSTHGDVDNQGWSFNFTAHGPSSVPEPGVLTLLAGMAVPGSLLLRRRR